MTRALLIAAFLAAALISPGQSQTLVAARTIPARTVLSAADVTVTDAQTVGAHHNVQDVVGLEARVTLYAGRPVGLADLGPAALIDRNDIVTLVFRRGALKIETNGRALDRAASGAGVRVMNLASRTVVIGRVAGPGLVEVGP
ncbi:MAG: flagellar basal body P-ring formation chaperone FlgA [Pseudomonadota bacterium]